MKTIKFHLKIVLFIISLFLIFSCSKDSDEEQDLSINRCFIVQEKHTNNSIDNAKITLVIKTDGYGSIDIVGTTNQDGKSCIRLKDSSYNLAIMAICCNKEGYKPFQVSNPPLNFYEIILEPQ